MGSILGRHTLAEALLVFGMLPDVCLCIFTYVSTHVVQCPIDFGGHIMDVLVPA